MKKSRSGFTIIELLIVIVVIAILAAITVIAYNGIQKRARDSQRKSDMALLQKALEMYYLDNGKFPASTGAVSPNGSWSSSGDSSWENLTTALKPYISSLRYDPINTANVTSADAALYNANTTKFNYSYYSGNSSYCSSAPRDKQMYIIGYRMEGAQNQQLIGNCTTNPIGPYPSTIRVVK